MFSLEKLQPRGPCTSNCHSQINISIYSSELNVVNNQTRKHGLEKFTSNETKKYTRCLGSALFFFGTQSHKQHQSPQRKMNAAASSASEGEETAARASKPRERALDLVNTGGDRTSRLQPVRQIMCDSRDLGRRRASAAAGPQPRDRTHGHTPRSVPGESGALNSEKSTISPPRADCASSTPH